ncbi:hypothetical protein [Streptomyces sp. 35M1]|uniref:hypothetical protein n=1 Tax=Streptomyces sp. 35M1 TaxID=3142978 RepID=UPI003990A83F
MLAHPHVRAFLTHRGGNSVGQCLHFGSRWWWRRSGWTVTTWRSASSTAARASPWTTPGRSTPPRSPPS